MNNRLSRRSFLAKAGRSAVLTAASAQAARLRALAPAPRFPADFAWGASTSAMQVEGYPYEDGGGRSVWSALDHDPAKVKDGSSILTTDDTYHRWAGDIPLMREMGLNAYRLSIGWPRVLPEGRGQPNPKGLDYYDRLLDGLLKAGITPWVTVFHFDYPEALQAQGGWLNEDSPAWLADYAHLLARRYGDRVSRWMTINEPNIFWSLSSEAGAMPPGTKLSRDELARGAHHILLAHGRSVQALRAGARKPLKVGLPFAGMFALPATESPADIQAAREKSYAVEPTPLIPNLPPLLFVGNGWWLDPIYTGKYNPRCFELAPSLRKLATPESMAQIGQRLDFCAVNLYFGPHVRAGADGRPEAAPEPPGTAHGHNGWPVVPDLLYWAPRFLHERYQLPVVITENGISLADKPDDTGRVRDPGRAEFLRGYLRSYLRASAEGVPLGGYFHWSLLDNWEFTSGFTEQFGLVYVDHATQKRTAKDSAQVYREIIRTRGASLSG